MNPWLTEKNIQQHIGNKPRLIRSKPNDSNTLVVEFEIQAESKVMSTRTDIDSIEVTVSVKDSFNR